MASQVQTTMKAVFLTKFVEKLDGDLAPHFEVKEIPIPTPQPGQVLVRMAYAPINPSDIAHIQNSYNPDKKIELPCRVGFEGSGTVVSSGGGLMAWYLQGKRVAVSAIDGGTWAEYIVTNASFCIPLPDHVSLEQGCSAIVNPLTAVAFVDIAKSKGAKTIVHTAAASALGKMLVRYAATQGLNVICVVRKDAQVKILKEVGAQHIVNTENANWKEEFSALCLQHDARLAFDAVGGSLTGDIVAAMPVNSEVQVYGGLSGEGCSNISPLDLIFRQKRVVGMWLSSFLANASLLTLQRLTSKVSKSLNDIFATTVRQSYNLGDVASAIGDYSRHMTEGKSVFKM